jgi:3-oxoacyl-[acyl-carrier protein] reductase
MFKGKNVIVTGGSRGIGKKLVEEFAANGANVLYTYNSNESAALEIKTLLDSLYKEQTFTAVQCNISKYNEVDDFFENHIDNMESIDVLVNNAGITDDALMIMLSENQWDSVIQTNLNGSFYVTQKIAFKMLRQKSGNIINISSVAGIYGNAGQCNYAASKAGLIGMSKSLSKELASRNIRVNVIAPGFIETDMTSNMSEKDRNTIFEKIGMKRFGHVEDISNMALFLASDRAQYITGQTLVIDGGLVL